MTYTLHTEISGAGEPLVLIHGMGSASTAWKPIRPLLNPHFKVITLDLPGHGKTPYLKGQPMDPHSFWILLSDHNHLATLLCLTLVDCMSLKQV